MCLFKVKLINQSRAISINCYNHRVIVSKQLLLLRSRKKKNNLIIFWLSTTIMIFKWDTSIIFSVILEILPQLSRKNVKFMSNFDLHNLLPFATHIFISILLWIIFFIYISSVLSQNAFLMKINGVNPSFMIITLIGNSHQT